MRYLTLIFPLLALITSCGENEKLPKISVMTTITVQKNGVRTTRDSVAFLTSKYFEIGLYKIDSNRYHAEMGLETPKSPESFRISYRRIVNEDSTILPFYSAEEFKNFMKA